MELYNGFTQEQVEDVVNGYSTFDRCEPKPTTSTRSEIYRIDGVYCMKIYLKPGFVYELEILKKLQGKNYAPEILASDEDREWILMRWIDGLTLSEYLEINGEYPEKFLLKYLDILIDIAESEIDDPDINKGEHYLWDCKKGVKKIDYDVADIWLNCPYLSEECNELKNLKTKISSKNEEAIDDFANRCEETFGIYTAKCKELFDEYF